MVQAALTLILTTFAISIKVVFLHPEKQWEEYYLLIMDKSELELR